MVTGDSSRCSQRRARRVRRSVAGSPWAALALLTGYSPVAPAQRATASREGVAAGAVVRRTCPWTRPPGRAARRRPLRERGGLRHHQVHDTSVRAGDVDDRHIRRVSGQRLGDLRPVGADEHHTAQPLGDRRATSSSTSAPLSRPPATHTTCSKARSDGGGRVRVGRLGVVDEAHARRRADLGDPVRVGGEGAQPVAHGAGRHPVGAGQRGRRQRVGDVVRRRRPARRPHVVERASSAADVWRCSTNARSASTSSTTPTIRQPGVPEREPDGAAPLLDVGVPTSCSVTRVLRRCRRRRPWCCS